MTLFFKTPILVMYEKLNNVNANFAEFADFAEYGLLEINPNISFSLIREYLHFL